MSPLKLIVAVTTALVFLSFSATIACNHAPKDAVDDDAAVSVTGEADTVAEAAPAPDVNVETPRSKLATVKATMRAGLNLTKALYRAATHTAFAVARTLYHTATALT